MFKSSSILVSSIVAGMLLAGCANPTISDTKITTAIKVGAYNTHKEGGSEIIAYDKASKRVFTTNGEEKAVDIIDISDVTNPKLIRSVDITRYGTGINSVAVHDGLVAVAIEDGNSVVGKKQLRGSIALLDTNGNHIDTIKAGYLPDMVTFSEDGKYILVANEGEPNGSYSVDPEGSIGIYDIDSKKYTDIRFTKISLTSADDGTMVRVKNTPSDSISKDIEPEYITTKDGYAYVTLQENNAIAKVDIKNKKLIYVKSLGAKSYEEINTIDIEENGIIEMKSFKGLFGLYQPDSIASYKVGDKVYLVTANEGDGREYCTDKECENPSHVDEKKIKKLILDPSIKDYYKNDNDLKVMIDLGDIDRDGDYDKLYTYGARSFTIWDSNSNLVYDSGDDISKKVAKYQPKLFNQDEDEMDGRSGNKGSEPEALCVGSIGSNTYAFVGLERQNAIMIYNITDPKNVSFVDYIDTAKDGDISPEGMKFVSAKNSPNGKSLLLVSYEMSGSSVIYELK
jgi:5'-nucleotidase